MKRKICLLLVLFISLSSVSVLAEFSWPGLPNGYYKQPVLVLQPHNNYHSYQNSPNFTWPIVYDATYELRLCNDKEFTDVAYNVEDIKFNMYTFPKPLEAGRDYYWAVRYKLNGQYSDWSEIRRLYIDEESLIYVVPDVSEIGSKLKEHPYYFDEKDFESFKKLDQTHPEFIKYKQNVDRYVKAGTHTTPEIKYKEDGSISNALGYVNPVTELYSATVMYYITGEEIYKNYAIDGLEFIKDYKPEEFFAWEGMSDTAEAMFVSRLAIAYDLLYPYLTDVQIENTIKLIERNMVRVYENFGRGGKMERSLYAEPYGSHNWRLNQTMLGALVIYNESQLARDLFNFHFPMISNVLAPYIYQDGSYGQGVFYGSPMEYVNIALYFKKSGIFDLTKKGGLENNVINLMYRWPSNWINSIGDSYSDKPADSYQSKNLLLYGSAYAENQFNRETAKWLLTRSNGGDSQFYYVSTPDYALANANYETDIKMPFILPQAKYFPDTGWICMYSDLKNDDRVGMIFKSSWFGSLGHSHPDQNSFVLQAYGKELARDSEYYDAIGSSFDVGFNRKTYAHNAITYDNGTGQPANSISSKGVITGFVNQSDFKLAAGDAQKAYKAALSKANRDIIYINPETFIVIDDLATNGSEFSFEYFLNTMGEIEFYDNKKGATITADQASMEVRAHYPEKITPYYIDYFAGPDLSLVTPPTMAENVADKRLYFQTEETKATKIVTTLDVHHTSEKAGVIKEEINDTYLKLSFEDGSVCYINLTDEEKVVTKDAIEFSGLAFIMNEESFMLVKGREASYMGEKLVSCPDVISVAAGKNEISVSNIGKETEIEIYGIKTNKLIKHIDDRFYHIEEGNKLSGAIWNKTEKGIKLNLYPGTYTFYTDGKLMPGTPAKGTLKITENGKTEVIEYESEYDTQGRVSYEIWPEEKEGIYKVTKLHNVSMVNTSVGDIIKMSGNFVLYAYDAEAEFAYESLSEKKYETVVTDDEKSLESKLDGYVRATDFTAGGTGSKTTYWQRIDNNTLQNFNNPMNDISYEIEVSEDGKYDLCMSVSTVSGDTSDKILIVGDNIGVFNIPATDVYSNLQGLRVKCEIELKAGKNVITFMNADGGQCIYDWIGVIKSDRQ